MKILRFEQTLPISIETAWNFFSRPEKLSDITPKYMRFRVQSSLPEKIYAGLTIQYKVSLLFNIPVQWVTEIARVEEPHYFVDHQKKGPYRIWQHEHYFEQKEN